MSPYHDWNQVYPGFIGIFRELMAYGADPSSWNKKCQTPYVVAVTKEMKKAFQDFMIEYPDKYDYSEVS